MLDQVLALNPAPDQNRSALISHRIEATRETVHAISWNGRNYITGVDVLNTLTALVLSESIPTLPIPMRAFGKIVHLALYVHFEGCFIVEADTEFIDWLSEHHCVRSTRRQAIFYLEQINLQLLQEDIRGRCVRHLVRKSSS